jgi:methyl-accepting chemotaxis protein-1 (serine sensor receptor)
MKLALKVPLAFAAALLFVACGALFGIYRLDQSLDIYGGAVQTDVANERAVSDMLVAFKGQVQEWKDTLLRGKDPAKLEKHWGQFQSAEKKVDELAKRLLGVLPDGDSKSLVEKFAAAHGDGHRLSQGFRCLQGGGLRFGGR